MQIVLKIALIVTATTLTACADMKAAGGATENSLCQIWGESLPTRSRQDTTQTQIEIATAYADFAAACPTHEHLVPA